MKNKAKIIRQAERALKRTEFYLENRASNVDPKDNYELDYVLARKGGPLPDNAIAYAHSEEHIITSAGKGRKALGGGRIWAQEADDAAICG